MKELKKYLTINSLFSAISGFTMLLFSNKLNELFDISNTYIFPIIGANLLVFSAFVWYVSQKHLSNKMLVNIISFLDLLWVFGSFAIVMVAIWIAFLAYKQYKNNK
jgi:hypothetical protein